MYVFNIYNIIELCLVLKYLAGFNRKLGTPNLLVLTLFQWVWGIRIPKFSTNRNSIILIVHPYLAQMNPIDEQQFGVWAPQPPSSAVHGAFGWPS